MFRSTTVRSVSSFVVLTLWSTLLVPCPAMAVGTGTEASYATPTRGRLVDGFRPPASEWDPGNRGHEYATGEGDPVTVSAPGVVLFAGSVGTARHVTVLHPDGLRTSYAFLVEVAVVEGAVLEAGAMVGLSGGRFLFSIRDAGGRYLDPMSVLEATVRWVAELVAHDDPRVSDSARLLRSLHERSLLEEFGRWADRTGRWVVDGLGEVARFATVVALEVAHRATWAAMRALVDSDELILVGLRLARAVVGAMACTPDSVRPARPGGPHLAVLVGGLDAGPDPVAFHAFDTASLGFEPTEVIRFSYDGGRAPDPVLDVVPWLAPIRVTSHDEESTRRSVADTASVLVDLLLALGDIRSRAVIEVYGHSLGGLVAVTAAVDLAARPDPPALRVVTFSSPHGGLALAELLDRADDIPGVGVLSRLVGLPGGRPVVDDLAGGLDVEVPEGLAILSLAATADPVVPATRSRLRGATEVVVGTGGFHHDGLLAHPDVLREIHLFRAGRPPACRPLLQRVAAVVVPELIDEAHGLIAGNRSLGDRIGGGSRNGGRGVGTDPPDPPGTLPLR